MTPNPNPNPNPNWEIDTFGDQGAKLRRLAGIGTTSLDYHADDPLHGAHTRSTLAGHTPVSTQGLELGKRLEFARLNEP